MKDLKILSQRVRFKVKFLPSKINDKPVKKEDITEEKYKIDDKTANLQEEMLGFKSSIFRELPVFNLSLENYKTLEVIEDYLLNKLNCKEDFALGNAHYDKIFKSNLQI